MMGDEVTVCDICGDAGHEKLLAICKKCTVGAEHIYCMRVKLDKLPEGDWRCEECMVKSECQNSASPANLESQSRAKLKSKSSHAWRRHTKGVSSRSHLSAKRHGVPSEAESVKKDRYVRMSAEPPMSFKSCYNTQQHRDLSCKNSRKGKAKATKDVNSQLQISCNSQEQAKVPHAYGDKRCATTLEVELHHKKRMALETRTTISEASKPTKQSLQSRVPQIRKLGKEDVACSVCFAKQSSHSSHEKSKLPSPLGDGSLVGSRTEIARDKWSLLKSGSSKTADEKFERQLAVMRSQKRKVEKNVAVHDIRKGKNPGMVSKSVPFNSASSVKLNGTCSEAIVANAYCPVVLKNSSSAEESKASKWKYVSELHNPALLVLASGSGVVAAKRDNRTVSGKETFISGSSSCRLDGAQSCGQLDCQIQPNSHKTHKKRNCQNEEKKNESWQTEQLIEAAAAMKLHELCTHPGSDEHIWLGKFQIRRGEGSASTCVGIKAHLPTYASQKVHEIVDRLPDIVVLEELPRLRMWSSQFMESRATEENIAIYFFAKDLHSYGTHYRGLIEYMSKNDFALKGNLGGAELLIFPSDVLPEKSQCLNKLLFLWGVFREPKIDNSSNTPISSSRKQENRDTVSRWALDLNVNPQDGNDVVQVHEIGESDSMDTRSSSDSISLGGGDEENVDLLHWQAIETLFSLSKGSKKI